MGNKWIVLTHGEFNEFEFDEEGLPIFPPGVEFMEDWYDWRNKKKGLTEEDDEYLFWEGGVEIAVVLEDNEHGLTSGGWPGPDKIILTHNVEDSASTIRFYLKVAKALADKLNELQMFPDERTDRG